MTFAVGIPIILFCVLLEAFFSGSEIAMVHANRVTLEADADAGDRGAQRALSLLSHEPSLLGTCLMGTNLCTVTGSTVAATLILTHGLGEASLATIFFTPLTLILGEALPKTVMQQRADQVVPKIALPLQIARTVFSPALWVVDLWNRGLTAMVGAGSEEGYLTRAELLDLLEQTHEGPIDPEERRLIRGVLSMSDSDVEACMTPLVRVVAVEENATVGVAADIAARTQHSILPVYRGRIDNIVGMVHQADLLFLAEDGEPLAEHVRPATFVPDTKSTDALFADMRTTGDHFAVVVDEYGGCVGIVTLEDLLEEFVGDIEDERDMVRPAMLQLADGAWSAPGNTELDDVADRTGISLPEGDYETVAGLILADLGRIPVPDELVEVPGARLRVLEANERAILRVRLEPLAASVGDEV